MGVHLSLVEERSAIRCWLQSLRGECILPITSLSNDVTDLSDFDAVFDGNRLRIYRFLLSSLRDPDIAETLTQECFFKAYKARDRFRGEAQVSTWLTTRALRGRASSPHWF
jgi:RNA polymerase sigma-70 factor (ECF subfamily)